MFIEDENIFELDESDFADTPTADEEESTVETDVEQTSDTKVETPTTEEKTDEEKFLDFFNSKDIKYNGELVKAEKFDDLISTYQKGLNYDKLKAKTDEVNNSVMSYIETKAKSMGLSAEQYIERVKSYEKEQEKAQLEKQIQNMVERGIDEETARKVAETNAYMEQLKAERAEFEKQKAEMQTQKDKDQEYEEFLKMYPEVKANEIPPEVFENAKTMGLKSAYALYENKLLKEKLKLAEQNKMNASTSVVKAVSNGNSVQQQSEDDFVNALFYKEE